MITIRRAMAGDADALVVLNQEFNGVCRTGPTNDAIERLYCPLGFQPSRQILLYRANAPVMRIIEQESH